MSAIRKSGEEVVRLGSGDDLTIYQDALTGHGPHNEVLIEVDRDDDLTSLRSKLEGVTVPRAVLVVPPTAKALRDGLEFRVLRRLQRELGLDLVIVSDDVGRRGFARENGFRNVFSSVRNYYRSKTPTPDQAETLPFTDPEEFTPSLGISRWGVIVGAIVAVVAGLIALVAAPAAQVTVYPEGQTLTRDVEVLVEIGGPKMDVTSQRLAGRVIQDTTTVSGSVPVKGVQPASQQQNPPQNTALKPGTNVTLDVRDALRQQLQQQATAEAMQKMKAQLKSNESMPEKSIHTDVTGEKYDHNIGDVADNLSGSMDISSSGLAFNNDDFNKLVTTLWSQDIPRDFKATADPKMDPPTIVTAEGQHMTLRVHVSGSVQRDVDTDAVASAVRAKPLSQARQQLAGTGEFVKAPDITMWPEWAPLALRVQVKTVAQQAPTPPTQQ